MAKIQLKTGNGVPPLLTTGEAAFDLTNQKLYISDGSTNTIINPTIILTQGAGITITGAYPSFTITANNAGSVTSIGTTAPITGGTITSTGTIGITQSGVASDGYLSTGDWNIFNNKQPAGNYITALTGEATASGPGSVAITLTNSAVIGKVLTGLNVVGSAIVATDTILEAFGKTQNQINALVGGLNYQGVWNASTNTPTLTSSVGTKGYYYKVSVAGNTNLDGITDWEIGDLAIFNGTVWDQIDNTDSVSSVNGYTGAVSLTTDDVPEGATNLYYTDARARAAISLTTTGSSGAATYNSTTGVFNIPDYGAGQFWTRVTTTLSPATANDKIFASSVSGSTIEALNTGAGGLAFYGNSTNGVGAQFQSGSAGDPGLIVKNISGGPIQHWFNHLTTVASVANNGNFTGTAFITTGGTASQVVLGNGALGTLASGTDFIQNQVASTQTAGFKISGDGTLANLTASTKVNVASPSGTTGDVNTGQAGIYSYRSAGRYVRFNTSGTFNDFLSLGAKLVMNYGFSGTVENISMFEGSSAGDGQFIVGSPTATNARFLLKGKDTGTTNYISRWFDSGNTEKFSVRNDGQTTVASLSAGGIVKSTAGVLSIATANTDYAPGTGGTGYIQNQYSVIQTASMAISGIATITDGVIAGGAPGITGVPRFLINQAASGNIQVEFPTSTLTTLAFTVATGSQTITFPDATGTVALTSALSSYLPLSGGTLTGALTGTSATFSGGMVAATGEINNFNGAAGYGITINTNNNTGSQYLIDFQRIGTQAGYIASTSSTTVGIFNTSDYRTKEDLKTFSGVELVKAMNFYDFKWKVGGTRDYGVIAHELQSVLPNSVIGEKDGKVNQAVDYVKLVPIYGKAIQEQQVQISDTDKALQEALIRIEEQDEKIKILEDKLNILLTKL